MAAPPDALKAIRAWVVTFIRAIRACRLYPPRSSMRQQQIELAYTGLSAILRAHGLVNFGIRDGALFFGEEEVFQDDDQRNGPTHLLAGHSIFELAFQESIDAAELEKLVLILAEDAGYRRRVGEELVTLIWRQSFKHLRYRHVDMLSMAVRAETLTASRAPLFDDDEMERLRREIARMVLAMSRDPVIGQDEITRVDGALAAPGANQAAAAAEQQRFAELVSAQEQRAGTRTLDLLRVELRGASTHDALTARLADLLLEALREQPDPLKPGPALGLVQRLFATMVRERDFTGATHLVERARELGRRARRDTDPTLARGLLLHFSGETPVFSTITALDSNEEQRHRDRAITFLRALGDEGLPVLLPALDRAEKASTRELLCGLAVELTARRRGDLLAAMRTLKGEVSAQILRAIADLSLEEQAPFVRLALDNPNPSVRAHAVRALSSYAPPRPDELITRALFDVDPRVRATAIRSIAARRYEPGARQLAHLALRTEGTEWDPQVPARQRGETAGAASPGRVLPDPAELRLMLVTAASILPAFMLEPLERLMHRAAGLTSGYKQATLEAATFALSVIESPAAKEQLAKGARSLNPKLRAACKLALEQGGRAELARAGALAHEVPKKLATWPAEGGATELARPPQPAVLEETPPELSSADLKVIPADGTDTIPIEPLDELDVLDAPGAADLARAQGVDTIPIEPPELDVLDVQSEPGRGPPSPATALPEVLDPHSAPNLTAQVEDTIPIEPPDLDLAVLDPIPPAAPPRAAGAVLLDAPEPRPAPLAARPRSLSQRFAELTAEPPGMPSFEPPPLLPLESLVPIPTPPAGDDFPALEPDAPPAGAAHPAPAPGWQPPPLDTRSLVDDIVIEAPGELFPGPGRARR